MARPRVLVTHNGARHNYALPAAFADAGMLEAFYTDMCGGKGLGSLAEFAGNLPLPAQMKQLAKRLANRRPPANVLALTRTDELAALKLELAMHRAPSPQAKRERLVAGSTRMAERLAKWGLGEATHLFNVLGHGGELVCQANAQGIPVLADIIIALSTRQICWREFEAYPEWGAMPADNPETRTDGFDPQEHLLSTTDVFVCPSAFVADDLVENWGVDRASTRIVPYALKSDWFELEPQTIPGRVLFVGSAERRKGIHYLAFAAQEMGKQFDFRVAGGVPAEVLAQPEAASLNFLGRVPRDQIKNEFSSADVFVLPTLAEGSATVVYEALAAGLPVVTTKAAGSVVRDGVDGIIVPERDHHALAAAIERITSDRDLRESMSRAARENARKWNWETYANSLRSIVEETTSPIESRRDISKAAGGNSQ